MRVPAGCKRQGGGIGKIIITAHHEMIEGEISPQMPAAVRTRKVIGQRYLLLYVVGCFRFAVVFRYIECELTGIAQSPLEFGFNHGPVLILYTLFRKKVRTRYFPGIFLAPRQFQGLDPHSETVMRNLFLECGFNLIPYCFHRLSNTYVSNLKNVVVFLRKKRKKLTKLRHTVGLIQVIHITQRNRCCSNGFT